MTTPWSFRAWIAAGLAAICAGPSLAGEWRPAAGSLLTRWAKDVSPASALPEYPRPQMVRARWQNLNGLWDYAITSKAEEMVPARFHGSILVP